MKWTLDMFIMAFCIVGGIALVQNVTDVNKFCTTGELVYTGFYDEEADKAVQLFAGRLHWSKEMIDSVIFAESSYNPKATNGSHCGCPQLNEEYYLKPNGITCKEFIEATCTEQIEFAYVVYWKKYKDKIKDAADLWRYNMCPRATAKDHEVMYCRGRDGKRYLSNIKTDFDGDGCITKTDLENILKERKYPKRNE